MTRSRARRFTADARVAALAVAFAACAPGTNADGALAAQSPERYAELYQAGKTWDAFLADVNEREALWRSNTARATAPEPLLDRLRAAGGEWKLLVVAVDGCSDSVSTIPYIARLVAAAPNVDLRIVDSTEGRAVMEAHRTPDGRAATPTVILLNASFAEAGAWIERPAALLAWYGEREREVGSSRMYGEKMEWYDRDAGAATMEDIVALIEAAAAR